MDRLDKELRKLTRKELERVDGVLARIERGLIDELQVKQLKGYAHVYRVRVGRLRVIYTMHSTGVVELLAVRRRDNQTYRDF